VFRSATDGVEFTQTVPAKGPIEWKVTSGGQALETGMADRTKLVRWGHLQDGKDVVAFAVDSGAGVLEAGTYTMTMDGTGQTAFRVRPAAAGTKHTLTLWEHYVASPVQIGAATSPASILAPLTVTVGGK